MKRNFIVPNVVLKLLGLWTFEEPEYWLYRAYRAICMPSFILVFSALELIHLFKRIIEQADLAKTTDDLIHAANHVLGVYKYVNILTKARFVQTKYEQCMNDERYNYESKRIHKEAIIDEFRDMNFNMCSWLYILATMFVCFGYSAPLLTEAETIAAADNVTMITTRALPFNTWVPFDEGLLPHYYWVYAYQGLSMVQVINMIGSFDIVVYGLLGQMAAQFKILSSAVATIKERSNDKIAHNTNQSESDPVYRQHLEREMLKQLKKCIVHHQFLINSCHEIRLKFNLLFFFQFNTAVVVLCVCLFQCLLRTGFTADFFYMIFFAITTSYELFLYCWFGKEITAESDLLPTALLSAFWVEAPAQYMSNYRLFLLRSQKPIVISAMGLFPLNLSTFGSVIKSAYSYFSVLKQTYNP